MEKLQSRLAKAIRDLETERKLRVKAETDSSETEQRLIELKKRSIKLTKEVFKNCYRSLGETARVFSRLKAATSKIKNDEDLMTV